MRQKKQPLEKLVAAQEVDEVPEEQEEVIRNMNEMFGYLTRGDESHPVNVLECIINHRSFSQTIENLFALSFLVSLPPGQQLGGISEISVAPESAVFV